MNTSSRIHASSNAPRRRARLLAGAAGALGLIAFTATRPASAMTGEEAHRLFLQGDTSRHLGAETPAPQPAAAGSYARYLVLQGASLDDALTQARDAGERHATPVVEQPAAPAAEGQPAYDRENGRQ